MLKEPKFGSKTTTLAESNGMYNQDDIANKLTRTDLEDLNNSLWLAGMECATESWGEFVKLQSTVDLIKSHGWAVRDYVYECEMFNVRDSAMHYMMKRFCDAKYHFMTHGYYD